LHAYRNRIALSLFAFRFPRRVPSNSNPLPLGRCATGLVAAKLGGNVREATPPPSRAPSSVRFPPPPGSRVRHRARERRRRGFVPSVTARAGARAMYPVVSRCGGKAIPMSERSLRKRGRPTRFRVTFFYFFAVDLDLISAFPRAKRWTAAEKTSPFRRAQKLKKALRDTRPTCSRSLRSPSRQSRRRLSGQVAALARPHVSSAAGESGRLRTGWHERRQRLTLVLHTRYPSPTPKHPHCTSNWRLIRPTRTSNPPGARDFSRLSDR
jgi:hypothetical protein